MTPGNTSYMVIVPSPVSFFIWKTAQRSLCATGINELFHRIVSVNLSHPFVFYYSIFSKRSKAYCKISLPYPYINRFVNQWISLATTSSVTVQFAGRFIESPMDYQSVIESIPIVVGWFLFKSSSIAGFPFLVIRQNSYQYNQHWSILINHTGNLPQILLRIDNFVPFGLFLKRNGHQTLLCGKSHPDCWAE